MHHPRSPRAPLALQLIYDDGTAFLSGVAVNMSDTGAFIETRHPLAAGAEVRITPLFPEHTGPFELRAVVVRQGDALVDVARVDGMGVRFLDVGPETLAMLRAAFEHGRGAGG